MFSLASKGRSHLLLRTFKEKKVKSRNIRLYKDEESKSEEEKEEINVLKEEIKTLTKKIKEKETEINKNEKYADLLGDLFQRGIIDADGNFIDEAQEY